MIRVRSLVARPVALRWMAAGIALVAAIPLMAGAQQQTPAQRLGPLDAATRTRVLAIIDTARAHGLPIDPLIDYALEGASKGAAGAKIVQVVRTHLERLENAQIALGRRSSPEELTIGAEILRRGANITELQRVRAARPNQRVTQAVKVIAALQQARVPSDTAIGIVAKLSRSGATDDHLLAFGENVEKDVKSGTNALAAATTRAGDMERVVAATAPGNSGGAAGPVPLGGRTMGQTPTSPPGSRANVGTTEQPTTSPVPPRAQPAPRGKPKKKML